MNSKRLSILAAIVITAGGLFILGCGAGTPAPAAAPKAEAAQDPTVSPTPIAWQADGIIAANEYTSHQKFDGLDVYSRVDGDTVLFGLRAKTGGYIAIGIGAEDKMKGADMLLCHFKDGQPVVTEMSSKGTYGPHPAKTAGSLSVSQVGGSQRDGMTIIELRRKLDPGGSEDKPLKVGENKIIWSIGSDNDIDKKHTSRGYGTLVLVR